jgi:hypothetical protein
VKDDQLPVAVCLAARESKSGKYFAALVASLSLIPCGLHAQQRQAFAAADMRRTLLIKEGQCRRPANRGERIAAEETASMVFDAFRDWCSENGSPDIGAVPYVWHLEGSALAA